jgi:hypothetical protein
MPNKTLLLLFLCSTWLIGCESTESNHSTERELHARIIESISDTGINNAIITQSTLFPYHFTHDGTELNELGYRDLGVLARHFKDRSGTLSVRQGSTVQDLHNARVTSVREFLIANGVDTDRIHFTDTPPRGPGISSEQVLQITARETTQIYQSHGASGTGTGAKGTMP